LSTSIEKKLNSLIQWIIKEDYSGWDPYDGLNGNFAVKFKKNLLLSSIFLQVNLYSPVNLRKLLGTKKMRGNKSIALIARAYLILYQKYSLDKYREEAKKLLDYLEKNSVIYNGRFSWHGSKFDYVSFGHVSVPSVPTVVGTTEAVKTLCKAYEVFHDPHYLSVAESAIDFMVNELLSQKSGISYMKYYPSEDNKLVVNVSALSLETFSTYLKFRPSSSLIHISNELVKTITKLQAKDGRWPYSYYFKNKFFYNQIDYHQGFILDGLTSFLPYTENESIKETIHKGAAFYRTRQFTDEGVSAYRLPIKYPIDIHNQAQGIITFTHLSQLEKKYGAFSNTILTWTLEKMQSPYGYFYSHRWPFFVNNIPYMRWSQAWMMLSIATYLSSLTAKNTFTT
jgi:rhamnogalacturonyl hydrolase YesR